MEKPATEPRPAPWRGRPRAKNPRTRFIGVRCTEAEYAAIVDRAEKDGLDLGAYLRKRGTGRTGARTRRHPTAEMKDLARLLGAIGHLGGNINQLAKHANQTGDLPDRAALIRAADEIEAMRRAMFKVLKL
jgi:hypothetical protein